MKKYIYLAKSISIFLFAISFVSCSDFFDTDLADQYEVDKYYKDDEQAAKALYGTYASVKGTVFGSDFVSITDVMSDDMLFQGTDQARRSLTTLFFDTRNKYFVNMWSSFYDVIQNANLLIDKIPRMQVTSDKSKKNQEIMLAEAKFIRAWAYFNLVQLWGEVPYVSDPSYSVDGNIRPSKSSVEDIYKNIIKDLDEADGLDEEPYYVYIRGEDIGYQLALTKGAVRLLKAKVYLAMKKYPECIESVQYIIDRFNDDGSSLYTLADYNKIFDVRYKTDAKRKKEVIWEIEALAQTGYNNKSHREYAPKKVIAGCLTKGYQNYIPSTSLFEAFSKQSHDKRFVVNYQICDGVPSIFKRVDAVTTDQNLGAPNEILLRVSDAVLVYAEALNATNKTDEAVLWINKIRKRAGLIIKDGSQVRGDIKVGTDKTVVQETRLFERRLEFAHEGQRLFDLRRTGKLMDAIAKHNKEEQRYMETIKMVFSVPEGINKAKSVELTVPFAEVTKNLSDRFLLHPIPTDEIQSNPNLKPNNNGYN